MKKIIFIIISLIFLTAQAQNLGDIIINSASNDVEHLYVCNAGIMHPAATNTICYEYGTSNLCQGGDHNCVCYDSSSNNRDAITVAYGPIIGDSSSTSVIHASPDAYNTIFNPTQFLEWDIKALQVNLGSERFGAKYFVDVCYDIPEFDVTQIDHLWCHVTPGNPGLEQTLVIPRSEFLGHILIHPKDYPGKCLTDIRVPVCHVPPGNPANVNTILVSPNAVPAFLKTNSLSYLGECNDPTVLQLDMMLELSLSITDLTIDPSYTKLAGLKVASRYDCFNKLGLPITSFSTPLMSVMSGSSMNLMNFNDILLISLQPDYCRFRIFFDESKTGVRVWLNHAAQVTTFTKVVMTAN